VKKNLVEHSIRFFYLKAKNLYFVLADKGFKKRYSHIPSNLYSLLFNNARVIQLAEKLGVSFSAEAGFLVANIPIYDKNVKFILDKQDCFALLDEQFLRKTLYNFIFDVPVVVIDIGMSVGDTALFFAANSYVKKVYSYELMPQTYDRAVQNFKLNSDIVSKIEGYNYGLGRDDQELEVPYYDDFDLGNGTFNIARRDRFGKGIPTTCKIKNIVPEMQRIVQEHPNVALYLKIDAEGAEYEIIDAIFYNHLSNNIRYIAMEYHFGVQNIIEILKKHHFEIIESFNTFCLGDKNNAEGNIQAVRQIECKA